MRQIFALLQQKLSQRDLELAKVRLLGVGMLEEIHGLKKKLKIQKISNRGDLHLSDNSCISKENSLNFNEFSSFCSGSKQSFSDLSRPPHSNTSWVFKVSEQPEKSLLSNKERDEFFSTEKENLQNKSDKKVSLVFENSCSNFLSPDQDKLAQIFDGKATPKEEKLGPLEGRKKSSSKKQENLSNFSGNKHGIQSIIKKVPHQLQE